MKANLKLKKNVILSNKNVSKEKNDCKASQIVNDVELLAISEKIINRNKKVYVELAK